MSYYFSKKLGLGFEEAIEKVTEALKSEGFGILTEIDVKETLKKNGCGFSSIQNSWCLQSSICLQSVAGRRQDRRYAAL